MSAPIQPARIVFDSRGLPQAPEYGDRYHAEAGALAQARAVFLDGCGLLPGPGEGPAAWAGRERFTVLETGFGLGQNFLATWAAWREDPRRPRRLLHLGLELHPPRPEDLARALAGAGHPPGLVEALRQAWPPAVRGWHRLDLQDDAQGRVTLQLGFGEAEALARGLDAAIDAVYLDGFAPDRNPALWSHSLMQALARRCRPGARAATWSVARPVREALAAAGFRVERRPGFAGKRDRLVAHFAPVHRAAPPPGGPLDPEGPAEAMVVGAGLAGCAAAWALAREGWAVTLVDAEGVAAGASGNPAGLMHASFSADDGVHARALRAAALRTAAVARPWLAAGRLPGALDGFVRLDPRRDAGQARAAQQRAGLPASLLHWMDGPEAAAACGLPLAAPGTPPPGAWWQAEGGWLDPAALCRAFLDEAAAAAGRAGTPPPRRLLGAAVARFAPQAAPSPPGWRLLDAGGAELACAPVLVLAAAGAVPGLVAASLGAEAAAVLGPLGAVRGQLSAWPAPAGQAVPRRAVSGAGYAMPPREGWLWTGATAHHDDPEPRLRAADHAHNRTRLAALLGCAPEALGPLEAARGRVGWRATTPDRLPWVGALPVARPAPGPAPRGLRHWPRWRDGRQGLYLLGGLGSRGLTWSALAGELLAHWVSGAPSPVEAELRDALDPARAAWRAGPGRPPTG